MFQNDNIIDWAMIAQQWIQMQSVGGNGGSVAVAPPNISGSMQFPVAASASRNTFAAQVPISIRKSEIVIEEEKGEADMVMSNDEDDDDGVRNELKDSGGGGRKVEPPPPLIRLAEENAAVMQSMQSSQWFMHQTALGIGASGPEETDVAATTDADAVAAWSGWPASLSAPSAVQSTSNPTAHIPSLMKLSVPNPNRSSSNVVPNDNIPEPEPVTTSNMDAAKRKMLPAWIREGLEKMERAKQKEREQEAFTKLEQETPSSQLSPHKLTVTSNTVTHSASDSSGNEEEDDAVIDGDGANTNESVHRRKITSITSRHNPMTVSRLSATTRTTTAHGEETDSDIDGIDATGNECSGVNIAGSSKILELSGKSYEKRLADLMIVVRRTLTELLLEVTNEEISQLANEALKSYKKKASSTVSVMIRNSALSSITGKLGLAAYADTSSSEEDDGDNVNSNDASSLQFTGNEQGTDSEEELKATIKSRRRAWAKISEEIEERLVSLAEREERQLKHYAQMEQEREDEPTISSGSTVGKSYERDFGETTETKLPHSNGKRQKGNERKERTSRFTDNKDTSSSVSVNSLTYLTQHIQQQNKQQQSHTLPINVNVPNVFPPTQTGQIYNQSSTKGANSTIAPSIADVANLHKQTNRSKCSPSSLELTRQGKKSHEREKERRRRHTSKHKHRSRIADGSHKGTISGSSISTSTSSSTLSTTSTSSRSSNDTDGDSSSSSISISNARLKKRKRHRSRSRSRNRSDKDRHNQRRRQHSSQRLKSQTSSRHEKSDRCDDEYKSKRSSRERRHHHHQRRHHRHRSSDSDEHSRSRSRSHSSYTSSSRHRRR